MKGGIILMMAVLVISAIDQSSYTNKMEMNPKYTLYWKIRGDTIFFGIDAETIGWVGLGIGEPTSGSMPGADILVASVKDGVTSISDRYATQKSTPMVDTCHDWTLISGEEKNGRTIIEVSRKLNTGDGIQDREIIPTSESRFLFAFGQTDDFSYHDSNRASRVIVFSGTKQTLPSDQESTWELRSMNFTVPQRVTTYAYSSLELPYMDGPFHMIAFEAIIDSSNAHAVHHFVLQFCKTSNPFFEWFLNHTDYKTPYNGVDVDCTGQIWGWAPGMEPYIMPEIAGFRVGPEEDDYKYLLLQTHYDNPHLETGMVDTSGVRIYYTTELRKYDAAVLALGDPYVDNRNPIPARDPQFHVEYECTPEATMNIPEGGINVFTSFMHMHQIGKQMWTTQWRDGKQILETNRIDFWDFGFQQGTPTNFTIMPGDRLNTHCVYNSEHTEISTKFGPASQDEMCIDFLNYYPRIPGSPHACGFGSTRGGVNMTLWGVQPVGGNATVGYPPNPLHHDPQGGNFVKFGSVQKSENCATKNSENLPSLVEVSNSGMLGLVIVGVLLVVTLVVVILGVAVYRGKLNLPFMERFGARRHQKLTTEEDIMMEEAEDMQQ